MDYRIINLATGKETYLYDVPYAVVAVAAQEHCDATGHKHYVQVVEPLRLDPPCEEEEPTSEPLFSLSDLFDQLEAERASMTFEAKVAAHIDAMGEWLDDMPGEEANAVRAALEEGAVYNYLMSFRNADPYEDEEDDGA